MLIFTVCILLTAYSLLLTASSAVATSHDVGDMLKTYLEENYPWEEIKMTGLTLSDGVPGELPERISVAKGPPGRTVFYLEFKNGGRITATANVKAFDRVIRSRRAFRKGHLLRSEDVYAAMMDVTRIPKGAVKNIRQITGKELSRSIIVNMPIIDRMVMETPAVKKGYRVVLLVEAPNFSVTAAGELKENGLIGDHVKVLNLDSKKVVTGVLLDKNTVKVEF